MFGTSEAMQAGRRRIPVVTGLTATREPPCRQAGARAGTAGGGTLGDMYAGSAWAPLGFVIVLAVLLGIWLFMRWAFSGPGGPEKRVRTPPPSPEDGLLVPVVTVTRRESALALRAVLSDAGIRSTVRATQGGRAQVLVFPEDADRARALVTSFPPA
jgi:hypothetical protein